MELPFEHYFIKNPRADLDLPRCPDAASALLGTPYDSAHWGACSQQLVAYSGSAKVQIFLLKYCCGVTRMTLQKDEAPWFCPLKPPPEDHSFLLTYRSS